MTTPIAYVKMILYLYQIIAGRNNAINFLKPFSDDIDFDPY